MHPAHRAFRQWLRGKKFTLVGQVWMRAGKTCELRHERDRNEPSDKLETFRHPSAARNLATFTDDGRFRPLKSAPNLRRGWRIVGLTFEQLVQALDCFYPAALAHWQEWRTGNLRRTTYRDSAARQTGMYRITAKLGADDVRRVAACCCVDGQCLKVPLWSVDRKTSLQLGKRMEERKDALPIPCPEPCSLFMSFARKAVRLEQEEPMKVEFTKSDLELIATVLRSAADGTLSPYREGDYNDPRHRQRILYLLKKYDALMPRSRRHETQLEE